MGTEYAWFLPSARAGDGRRINAKTPERKPTIEYLSRVARAAERAGFVNLLVPTGTHCMDAWLVAAGVAQHTERIKFCVALRPGLASPVFAAQTASTLDALTGGRLTLNVVTGSSRAEQMRYGDHLAHDERYERTEEFLEIVTRLWSGGGPLTYEGRYFDIRDAAFFPIRLSKPWPPIYLGGSSEAGRRVGAKFSDVHMMYAVDVETIARDARDMRERAAARGREDRIRFGVRMHVVCRESKKEARRAAQALIEGSDLSNVQAWSDMKTRTESAGQTRVNELAKGESLWVTDTLWMGVNTVRAGAGASLVGTPEMIAGALREYVEAGVQAFILSGWPHVEEAEIFGREVMPLLAETTPLALEPPLPALAEYD